MVNDQEKQLWNEWIELFQQQTALLSSINEIENNQYFKKLYSIENKNIVDILLEKVQSKNGLFYCHLFIPIVCKFYPQFSVDKKYYGHVEYVVNQMIKYIKQQESKNNEK